jgi:hypothetical protein
MGTPKDWCRSGKATVIDYSISNGRNIAGEVEKSIFPWESSFGKVRLSCSAAVSIDKDFVIHDPYGMRRAVRVKPARAYVELNPLKTFEMRIEVR